MKVVIDTNIIVSALMNKNSVPGRVLLLVFGGKLTPLFDNRTMSEYISVLSRREFSFDEEIINHFINFIKDMGEYVIAEFSGKKFTDEADKKFYEIYKSGEARYLITGNKKHFPAETGIVTPREFLEKEYEASG